MTNPATPLFRSEIFQQSTGSVFLLLVEITHDTGIERITSDDINTVHLDNTYTPYPFECLLPSVEDEKPVEATLSITNIDRRLIDEIQKQEDEFSVTLTVVEADDPDEIIAQFPDFVWSSVVYTDVTIEGKLTLENFLAEPFPYKLMTAVNYPGLFVQ